MTPSPPQPDAKRKWQDLAQQHLAMADLLRQGQFPGGAVFHTYHAFECIVSALIAARGWQVPPEGWTSLTLPSGKVVKAYPSPGGRIEEKSAHLARLKFFDELADRTRPYYNLYRTMRTFITVDARNNALYYNAPRNRLPDEEYSLLFAAAFYADMQQFVAEESQEI